MTFVKICGITRVEDAEHALRGGATALGFVFWPESPRCVSVDAAAAIVKALPYGTVSVGVFVNQPVAEIQHVTQSVGLSAIQLHGEEPPSIADALPRPVLKAASLATVARVCECWPDETLVLLDAHDPERRGGTGRTIEWQEAARWARRRRMVLAGGLTPSNVRAAIETVRPYGVDVSSGVEVRPGIKDATKMTEFLQSVRATVHA